jgi:CheY-like chemotaxis protein
MSRLALVVDDSMLVRHSVCRFLEERGFVVKSATNGRDALAIVARVLPDIVITDIDMPVMNGTELIRILKSKPETANIPIVIVAARSSAAISAEEHVEFAIFKDIEIEQQLVRALEATLAKPTS